MLTTIFFFDRPNPVAGIADVLPNSIVVNFLALCVSLDIYSICSKVNYDLNANELFICSCEDNISIR